MARLDLSGEAGFYFDTSNDQRADARFLAGLRTGYEAERWSVDLWVHNLFDERYPGPRLLFRQRAAGFPEHALPALGRPAPGGVTARYAF